MFSRRAWNSCLSIWRRNFSNSSAARSYQSCHTPNNIERTQVSFPYLQFSPLLNSSIASCRFYASTVPNEKPSAESSEKVEDNGKKTESTADSKETQSEASKREQQLMDDIAKLETSSKNTHGRRVLKLRAAYNDLWRRLKTRIDGFPSVTEPFQLWSGRSPFEDKYLRALAETENVRQRLTRQINDAKLFGIQSFVKDLLEVSDILTKAMGTVPEEALSDEKNLHLRSLFEGLRLTEAQLNKVFKKHGLEKIEAIGAKFDPNIHEALFQAPAQEGQEPGTVMAVTQTGFKLNNRTIRPARVGVAK